jgi:hypothetical protein
MLYVVLAYSADSRGGQVRMVSKLTCVSGLHSAYAKIRLQTYPPGHTRLKCSHTQKLRLLSNLLIEITSNADTYTLYAAATRVVLFVHRPMP